MAREAPLEVVQPQLWLEKHRQQSIAFDTVADSVQQLGVRCIGENGKHNTIIICDNEQPPNELKRVEVAGVVFIFNLRAWRSRATGTVKVQILTYEQGADGGDIRQRAIIDTGLRVAPPVDQTGL